MSDSYIFGKQRSKHLLSHHRDLFPDRTDRSEFPTIPVKRKEKEKRCHLLLILLEHDQS